MHKLASYKTISAQWKPKRRMKLFEYKTNLNELENENEFRNKKQFSKKDINEK